MAASMAILAGSNYALVYKGDKQAGYTQAAFLFIFNSFFASETPSTQYTLLRSK